MYASQGQAMHTPSGWRVAVAELDGGAVYLVTDPHGYARGSATPKHAGIVRTLAAVQALLGDAEFAQLTDG
jgi:hypothetical protein